jgi:hypothetical protein
MRKLVVFIVLISYLAVSTGIIVNFHYCMDRLDSTHLFAGKTDKCAKCGMHTGDSNGCCRDEVQLIKMNDDQKTNSAIAFSLFSLKTIVSVPSAFIDPSIYVAPDKLYHPTHSPPLLSEDIHIKNCVFRI